MTDVDPEMIHARRAATRRAIAVGGACLVGCLAFGKAPADSAIDGSIVTLGGLVAWALYHLISGRSDGQALTLMNTLPIWRDPRDPWVPTLAITTLAMVGVGLVMGLVNRQAPEPEPATAEFGLWDTEFDGPA